MQKKYQTGNKVTHLSRFLHIAVHEHAFNAVGFTDRHFFDIIFRNPSLSTLFTCLQLNKEWK